MPDPGRHKFKIKSVTNVVNIKHCHSLDKVVETCDVEGKDANK